MEQFWDQEGAVYEQPPADALMPNDWKRALRDWSRRLRAGEMLASLWFEWALFRHCNDLLPHLQISTPTTERLRTYQYKAPIPLLTGRRPRPRFDVINGSGSAKNTHSIIRVISYIKGRIIGRSSLHSTSRPAGVAVIPSQLQTVARHRRRARRHALTNDCLIGNRLNIL